MNNKTELRKLPAGHLYRLAEILELGQEWKKLMSIIPRSDAEEPTALKYKMEHISLIERASMTQRRRCSEIFLEEWSTSGRKRPDLDTLLQLLLQANLIRAAEFVAIDLLGGSPPSRPSTGPSASVDVSDGTIEELSRMQVKHLEQVEASSPDNDIQLLETSEPPTAPPLSGASDISREATAISQEMNNREAELRVEANTNERLMQIQETIQVESLYVNPCRGGGVEENPQPSPSSFDTKLPHFPYADLERFTEYFSDVPLSDPSGHGRKLGTGAFGSVYLGVLPMLQKVAVKKLNKDAINVEKQFRNEVEALSKFQHANLLPLLGYSCDGPNYCLVYEYMCNGSLQERLALKEPCSVLPWWQRINIGLGTARGIFHLHSAFEKPLIHRDVKTANILLNHTLQPKLGDFGLVRLGSNAQRSQSIALTTTVFGTSAYMAREAFRGDISVKIDSYSFGVVLLELLTGLPPFDDHREEGHDLVTYVETMCEESIIPILDKLAGDWGNPDVIDQLFSLSLSCLEDKRRRPVMSEVVQRLEMIVNFSSSCV